MFKSSYKREVRKEKYVWEHEDPSGSDHAACTSTIQGWDSLQELNSRFARYINRARVLEQRNAVFRKQLETLQRMEEASGLEEAFTQQITINRQRLRELTTDHAKLERDLKDACRMLDEYTIKYRNECEFQEQLRGTLEQLNQEADNVLLRNMECQIQSQFLQDDINSTKERHKKNVAEIQTYLNILHQLNQTSNLMHDMPGSISEEKLLAQRRVPTLQTQLEEYKTTLYQLHEQKQRLQAETAQLEQTIRSAQEGYDEEIQRYNDQIESLRKELEEAERSLEKYTSECRQLAMYQSSLENELERYKRIIENEDNRLNSAIIGTPITLFTSNYRYTHMPSAPSGGRGEDLERTTPQQDITQAMQDIISIKPRQKNQGKKKKRELNTQDVTDSLQDEDGEEARGAQEEGSPLLTAASPQDVPDGAQISKAFDTLCNLVRDRMRRYRRPEAIADFYTKGRYVLVTGDGSYPHPCFYTSAPSAGRIFVTVCDDKGHPDDPYPQPMPAPMPAPMPMPDPRPHDPTPGDDKGGKGKKEPHPKPKDPTPAPAPSPAPGPGPDPGPSPAPGPSQPSRPSDDNGWKGGPESRGAGGCPPNSMSYEKVETLESVERISNDRRVKGYEETATVVETLIEKTSRKKH